MIPVSKDTLLRVARRRVTDHDDTLAVIGISVRQIRQAVGSNIVAPKLLTYAERLQHGGYLRRQETNEATCFRPKEATSLIAAGRVR